MVGVSALRDFLVKHWLHLGPRGGMPAARPIAQPTHPERVTEEDLNHLTLRRVDRLRHRIISGFVHCLRVRQQNPDQGPRPQQQIWGIGSLIVPRTRSKKVCDDRGNPVTIRGEVLILHHLLSPEIGISYQLLEEPH